MKSFMLLVCSYVGSFILGASIDVIRHSADKVIPAIQMDVVDGPIIQRGAITVALTLAVVAGVYWGSGWAGRRFGIKHRTALQALFILTPIIVYILEH